MNNYILIVQASLQAVVSLDLYRQTLLGTKECFIGLFIIPRTSIWYLS